MGLSAAVAPRTGCFRVRLVPNVRWRSKCIRRSRTVPRRRPTTKVGETTRLRGERPYTALWGVRLEGIYFGAVCAACRFPTQLAVERKLVGPECAAWCACVCLCWVFRPRTHSRGGRVARRIYRGAPFGAEAVLTSRRYHVLVEAIGEGPAISRRRGPAEVSRGKGSLLAPRRRRSSNGPSEVNECSLAGSDTTVGAGERVV